MKHFKTYTDFINEAQSWNDIAKVMDAGLKKAIKSGSVPLRYAKDYIKSLERMSKRSSKKFFDEYGDFTEADFIEDVEYNIANESVNENFKVHMMYDPKTGKGYKAEKPEDHERMDKLGYVHEKPKEEDLRESAMGEIDLMAREAKDLKSFQKEIFKEFKDLPKSKDTINWLEGLYNSVVNESILTEAEKAEGDRSKLSADIEKALKDKATESGVPIGLLRLVMRRGLDAWNSSHRAGVPQVAWGYARVNAFLEKGKGTWGKADADIAKEVRDEGKAGKLPIKNPSEFTKKEREA